jgi:hypothetical protein
LHDTILHEVEIEGSAGIPCKVVFHNEDSSWEYKIHVGVLKQHRGFFTPKIRLESITTIKGILYIAETLETRGPR